VIKRVIPDTLLGRALAVLLFGVVISHLAGLLIYLTDRSHLLTLWGGHKMAAEIAAITNIVDSRGGTERLWVLTALQRPDLRLELSPQQPASRSEEDWRADALRTYILEYLGRPRNADVLISYREPGSSGLEDELSSRQIAVAIVLTDGSWLTASAPLPAAALHWSTELATSMTVMVLVVLPLAAWAIRSAVAPLREFANAAEKLGLDVRSNPLPEDGPRELRLASRALNDMQTRIRRLVEDRTQMLAAISHDLRTPITRLRLRAEFVESEEQKRKMMSDLDEMEQMIESTISFAHEDAATEPKRVVDLVALVESLCEDLKDAGSNVEFIALAAGQIRYECQLVGFKRAISNLIDNGLKYANAVWVTVSEADSYLEITIEDDGPGIPDAERERVFAPFYRIEASRSRETGGTGLGLSVARSIIRSHGGEILLESRMEGGLRVRILLPRRPKL
jgi:signal transduction histidine kinase